MVHTLHVDHLCDLHVLIVHRFCFHQIFRVEDGALNHNPSHLLSVALRGRLE